MDGLHPPRYCEFPRDRQESARRRVAGAEFASQFPAGPTAQQFVGRLFQNAGATPTDAGESPAAANARISR